MQSAVFSRIIWIDLPFEKDLDRCSRFLLIHATTILLWNIPLGIQLYAAIIILLRFYCCTARFVKNRNFVRKSVYVLTIIMLFWQF